MECCVKWSCVYTYIYYTDCCMSITHIWVRIPNTVFQTKRLLLSLFFFFFILFNKNNNHHHHCCRNDQNIMVAQS